MKPLSLLHRGVEQVSQGNLSFKQTVSSHDEVGDLARAFNKMTDDLTVYIKNLKETTTAKERIESELKIAHDIQKNILSVTFPPFPDRREIDIYALI
jgi:sigma-B regulation protein RsbU (phosphoserine phosphatase)